MAPSDAAQSPGQVIAQAADIITRTASEWHSAMQALRNDLAELNAYVFNEKRSTRRQEAPLWLHSTRCYDFEVFAKTGGRRSRFGSYTIFLELIGDGTLCGALGQPAVHIGWSAWGDFWREGWITLPLLDESMHLYEDRIFVWSEEFTDLPAAFNWQNMAWIYAFPLEQLNERADVRRLMVDPVLSLLDGKPVQEAFERQPEALRFKTSNGALELRRDAL